ncbi:MAG: hypothetical protein JW837_01005 [Sedimentisphaerales bacterium]|nr:hypothetical protein [Sedimentisphaerales bacterium]
MINPTIQKILCLFDMGDFRINISTSGQYQPRTATIPLRLIVIIAGSSDIIFKDTETYEAEIGAKTNQNNCAYSLDISRLSAIIHVTAERTQAANSRINCF